MDSHSQVDSFTSEQFQPTISTSTKTKKPYNKGYIRQLLSNSASDRSLKSNSPDKPQKVIPAFDQQNRRESLRVILQRNIQPIEEVPEEQRESIKRRLLRNEISQKKFNLLDSSEESSCMLEALSEKESNSGSLSSSESRHMGEIEVSDLGVKHK
mmetsp:Transcript_30209/g.46194  ORF Transcript_30209/g.46194 Transcript_30209/m.46194 type:complete len:155 (-) Transcript_30209:18-482(-)